MITALKTCFKCNAILPKTALVKRLMELRNAAIAKGMSLMTAEEISEELARRCGENEEPKK